jgi:hypothetical protein
MEVILNRLSTHAFAKIVSVVFCGLLIYSCVNPVSGPSHPPANHRLEGANFIASDAKLQLTLPAGSWKSSIDTTVNSTTYALWSTNVPTVLTVMILSSSGITNLNQFISTMDSGLVAGGATIISSDTIRVNGTKLGEIGLTLNSSGVLVRENLLLAINNNLAIALIYGVQNSLYSNYVNNYNSIKSSIVFN